MRNIANFSYCMCIFHPCWEWAHQKFCKIFVMRKLEFHGWNVAWWWVSQCDRSQTDTGVMRTYTELACNAVQVCNNNAINTVCCSNSPLARMKAAVSMASSTRLRSFSAFSSHCFFSSSKCSADSWLLGFIRTMRAAFTTCGTKSAAYRWCTCTVIQWLN